MGGDEGTGWGDERLGVVEGGSLWEMKGLGVIESLGGGGDERVGC